jgi:predicted phosphodiesterase
MRTSWLIGDRMVDSFLFVGLIADTHGLMRPEALDALQKADLIIHAGDIGKLAVLERLQNLVLFVNPGSAGPRRFTLPITVAMLAVRPDRCAANIIPLMEC